MTRVLFVDDEPRILQGLRRMMHPFRREWQMDFAPGGREALELIRAEPVDVVVTDMRMPGMTGDVLLAKVMVESPRTARFVLSGQTEADRALKMVGLAHRFLAKPCDVAVLHGAIERAGRLRELLAGDRMADLVGRCGELPPIPSTCQEMQALLSVEEPSFERITGVLGRDPALAAKILQIVSSSFFGLGREVHSVHEAARHLGFELLRSLVLGCEGAAVPAAHRAEAERVQQHSSRCAHVAARLVHDSEARDVARTGALLHDTGKLILAAGCEEYAALKAEARAREIPLWKLEEERLGTTHAEVGACLLGLWGLPDPVVEVVANHHRPERCSPELLDVVIAVHVADALTDGGGEAHLDEGFLAAAGCEQDLAAWQRLAEVAS